MITDTGSSANNVVSDTHSGFHNILFGLKQDTGRWCTEYTWDSDGNIWGFRILRNFGRVNPNAKSVDLANAPDSIESSRAETREADEENLKGGGLKGIFSAGAEIYVGSGRSAGGAYRYNSCYALYVNLFTTFSFFGCTFLNSP